MKALPDEYSFATLLGNLVALNVDYFVNVRRNKQHNYFHTLYDLEGREDQRERIMRRARDCRFVSDVDLRR